MLGYIWRRNKRSHQTALTNRPPCQMPELPEVETTRRSVAPCVVGRRIAKLIVYDPRLRWPVPGDLSKGSRADDRWHFAAKQVLAVSRGRRIRSSCTSG